ncbi:hypothetical protein PCE1_004198 [Barthelona sp. PCE]
MPGFTRALTTTPTITFEEGSEGVISLSFNELEGISHLDMGPVIQRMKKAGFTSLIVEIPYIKLLNEDFEAYLLNAFGFLRESIHIIVKLSFDDMPDDFEHQRTSFHKNEKFLQSLVTLFTAFSQHKIDFFDISALPTDDMLSFARERSETFILGTLPTNYVRLPNDEDHLCTSVKYKTRRLMARNVRYQLSRIMQTRLIPLVNIGNDFDLVISACCGLGLPFSVPLEAFITPSLKLRSERKNTIALLRDLEPASLYFVHAQQVVDEGGIPRSFRLAYEDVHTSVLKAQIPSAVSPLMEFVPGSTGQIPCLVACMDRDPPVELKDQNIEKLKILFRHGRVLRNSSSVITCVTSQEGLSISYVEQLRSSIMNRIAQCGAVGQLLAISDDERIYVHIACFHDIDAAGAMSLLSSAFSQGHLPVPRLQEHQLRWGLLRDPVGTLIHALLKDQATKIVERDNLDRDPTEEENKAIERLETMVKDTKEKYQVEKALVTPKNRMIKTYWIRLQIIFLVILILVIIKIVIKDIALKKIK